MFIEPRVSRAANEWVAAQPADKLPSFRRTSPGLVEIRGSILRYSTTTPLRES